MNIIFSLVDVVCDFAVTIVIICTNCVEVMAGPDENFPNFVLLG
jgi:hypothetical protein